jgi:hypothetical protein
LQIASRLRCQLLGTQAGECNAEGGLLAPRQPPDVLVELPATLVGEVEDEQPRCALEGVAFLPGQEHRLARGQRQRSQVIGRRMVAEILEPILAGRADLVDGAGGVVADRFQVTGEPLEEPAGAARQERAVQGMRQLVLEHDVVGAALLGAHDQHRVAEEIDRLVEGAHRRTGELVEIARRGQLEDAQLLAGDRVAMP